MFRISLFNTEVVWENRSLKNICEGSGEERHLKFISTIQWLSNTVKRLPVVISL